METSRKRVLVIGLDGGTLDLIEPWAAQGYLPNLASLMSNGTYGMMASTIQPTTAPAWVTFMTGVNQAKHGLYDFVRRRADSYALEVTNASHIVAPTIYDIASQYGQRVAAVNVPYTFPPRAVNGVIVGGPFTPTVTRDMVWPAAYFDRLKEIAPDYFILPDYDARAADPLADYAEKLIKGVELRERVALDLLQSQNWDLFHVVFMAIDEVQHTYWHCQDAPEDSAAGNYRHTIRDVYRRVDQAVGAMLNQFSLSESRRDTVVMIVSDHGGGAFHRMINLNRWLAEAGFLHFPADASGTVRRLRTLALKRLAEAYRHYVSANIRCTIRARLGIRRFKQIKEGFESTLVTSEIAWHNTRAYSLGAGGNIFINLQGREPLGIVAPGAEYEKICKELTDALLMLSDPETGERIVERVYRREELYDGPLIHQAPDLIIQWKDYAYWGRGSYDSHTAVFETQRHFDFSGQPLTGSHRPEGVLIMHGSGIRCGAQVEGARLLDMAPTILCLLGIPPLRDMDGQLLEKMLLDEEAERLRQIATQGSFVTAGGQFEYSPEEAEKISERLRSLGYL
jgi:predicted AlkP superfamily phosphohydrolase/phosphomutase